MHIKDARGFTLIELLVVITIIVVLLALLTPALDKAIYQAELAVCGANLKAIGSGVTTYAMGYKRQYPDRERTFYPPFEFHNGGNSHDLRPKLRDFMAINGAFNCSLNEELDMEPGGNARGTKIYSDYDMWFGYQYTGERGLSKLGDRLGYGGRTFGSLASDLDRIGNDLANNSHPDYDGVMTSFFLQDEAGDNAAGLVLGPQTISWWGVTGTTQRGPVDMNFVMGDGSVGRLEALEWDEFDQTDGRVSLVPQNVDDRNADLRMQIPRP